MRSTKTKEQIFRDGFSLFTNGQIPNEIFNNYMTDEDGEATSRLQWWCVDNMRGEIMDWCTGIGIIEAVEHLYKTALENGNFAKPMLGVVLNETELENDYPVYWDYLYVCDGKVVKSDIQGTVADLKRDLRSHYKLESKVITTCDIEGRRKLAGLS